MKYVDLLTIDDWMKADPKIRLLILQNIKLRERLWSYLKLNYEKDKQETLHNTASAWRPCESCETKGWVPTEPRLVGIHPSQMAKACLLELYNDMVGAEGVRHLEPRTMLVFDMGHAVHDMLQTYGKKGAWGPEYTPEVRLSKDYQELSEELMLEGHADAENVLEVAFPQADITYRVGLVHEYKTINTNGFEKLTRPKPEHQMQALIYAAALNRPVVVYLYFNKNDSNIVDFPIAFDNAKWANIEARIRLLKKHFEEKNPPPPSAGFHCQHCAYVFNCSAHKK